MLCDDLKVIGLDGDGAFAERLVVPAVNVVAVPDDVPDRLAALAEPFAVAAHAVDLAGVRDGERIGIVGPGTVGLLTLCALAGSDVAMIGRPVDARSLALGGQLGAAEIRTTDRIDDLRGSFDVIIETAGRPAAVTLGAELLGRGGRLVCVGLPAAAAALDSADLARNEKQVIGSRAYDLGTWPTVPARIAVAAAAERLVTHELALDEANEAIALLEARQAIKIILRPD